MDQEDQILAELSTLDDLLLPLSRSARLKYNCMTVSSRFIALGSNTGGIYLFSRETCNFLQVVFAEKETSPVMMAYLSPNDKYVAMASSSGVLHVIDLKLESRAKPETMRSTSDWNGTLTYLHWDLGCTKLYYGDSMGGVYEMTVHSSKAKNLFTLPPEPILKLDSSIVQIDKAGEKLLVSTLTRCYLCDTGKQQFSTIGKKLRDGQFGACFLCQGSSPTIYCARPGSRMWEVDIEGDVMNTHQFKQLLAIRPIPTVKPKEPLQLPSKDAKFNPQSLNYPRLKVLCGSYILTWTDSSLYILDPVNIKVVLWSQPFTGIQDVYCLNNEIFLFLSSMQVHCLSLLPVSRVTALCFKSEAFINAASLCIHFENSFCLKRKTNFDINSMRILYDKLFKAEMEELAEKLHSVILNTERKLAALSDSESTGSSKSRTNSFIEKNTSEKIPNHKIENPAITHYNNVNGNTLDVDGSLELFVNQNEDVRTADIETKVTDFKIAMGDVITESDRPDLVAFSNFKELGNAESSNNARFDTDDSDKVQNDHQGLGLDEIKVTSQDISAMRPVYKSSDLPQENLEQQNNSLNILTHNQQLEKGEKLICDMEDDKQLDVNEEMNIIENLEGSAQIQVEKANRDLVNTHTAIGAYTIEADTETIHVNGDEDSCMVKEIEDNIRTVIKSEADKEMSETDNGDLGNVVTTHIESVTAETLENISVNEDQGSERELDTIISHVSVIDTDLIKNQSENEMQSNHFENKINKDNETSADFGHLVVRAKSPAYTEYSPIRSKSPAPSTSSLKSNSSRKSGDLDDILEDDLDLIQSRSSNMGSRRLSLTSLSSLSSAEVVLEQVAGNFQEEIAVPVKRKSSKRRQRKSLEGSVEVKKKGVKVTRSFSLGAIQPLRGKDFSISPQGSLDQAIEEDCFTSVNLLTDKIQQETVSQSAPTSIEEHCRSLPNMEEFENETLHVPLLDLRPTEDITGQESVLSQSAEFSKSEEWSRSAEFSESPLLRSYDGTREGLSSSPKTALKRMRDKVQKNLKSQTKKVITNIKDKNLLSRAKEFLSQPIDMLEHQRSEFAIQEYYVQPSYKDETKVDETDSIPKCPVDITALQEITAETQTKLDDHSVLLDPGTVYKILLDWVTVLNKTFHELHLVKYTQSAQSHSEPASGDPGELEASKIVDNMKTTQGTETKEISIKHSFIGDTSETIGRVGEQKLVDTGKSALKSVDTPKPGEPGASILNDKDFCYTKDPLFLPANVFSNVSELAQVCFDLGCHGNILQYKDLQASQNKDEIKTLKSSKEFEENVIEFSDNLTDKSDIGTNKNFEDQGHSSESAQHSKGQGYKYEQDSLLDSEQDSLPGSSSKDICDTNLENANYTKLNESALMCSNHKESDSIVKQEKNADVSDEELAHMDFVGAVHKQNITENESGDAQTHVDLVGAFHEQNMTENDNVHPCPNNTIVVRGEGHCHSNSNQGDCHSNSNQGDCHGNSNEGDEITDEETAFFVRCYFPYLSAIKIRSKTKEHRKCWYLTWCALVSCLQELASEDSDRFGIDRDPLLHHMIESLSTTEDGYSLLGHVSNMRTLIWHMSVACRKDRLIHKMSIYGQVDLVNKLQYTYQGKSGLFTVKSSNLVTACAKCHPYIQPLDVLFLCKLHDVAIETTFKAYMQQMIQDATRTHRKDTISALYTHPEVKRAWLEILLAEEGNTQEMIDSAGNPCVMSHCHIWKKQPAIDTIVSQTVDPEDRNMVLKQCFKYGYWNGCLKILKDFGERHKQSDIILYLDDVRLINARSPVGYLPISVDEWKQLLQAYKDHISKSDAEAGSLSDVMPSSDWSDRITWDSLGNLLVRHLGTSQAVSLLQEMDIPESSLSASFYQTCAMAGLVHRHQRLVLHSMLEKIDTYLWAQRPVYSSPQLHYIVVKERELQGKGSNSGQQEHLQKLIEQMKFDQEEGQCHYVEDPDCHWGVETKINLVCPCCNIPLKEAVSHVEPGILLFKCGHGYHRMCLPERDCFLCLEDSTYTVQKAFI